MSTNTLASHWALIAATVPAAIVACFVLQNLVGRSRMAQLQRVLKDHFAAKKSLGKAQKSSEKAKAHVASLTSRAEHTRPRLLIEATEAAEDALELEKIANDRLLVTANHVRRVIVEEFPPVRHEKLRRKYLAE